MPSSDEPARFIPNGMVNGIPFRVDRNRALGNAVVPLHAREAFERLMGIHGIHQVGQTE
jgi:hypothetical protein